MVRYLYALFVPTVYVFVDGKRNVIAHERCDFDLCVVLNWGITGIWIAMATDEILRGITLTTRFAKGKWKKINLIEKTY